MYLIPSAHALLTTYLWYSLYAHIPRVGVIYPYTAHQLMLKSRYIADVMVKYSLSICSSATIPSLIFDLRKRLTTCSLIVQWVYIIVLDQINEKCTAVVVTICLLTNLSLYLPLFNPHPHCLLAIRIRGSHTFPVPPTPTPNLLAPTFYFYL